MSMSQVASGAGLVALATLAVAALLGIVALGAWLAAVLVCALDRRQQRRFDRFLVLHGAAGHLDDVGAAGPSGRAAGSDMPALRIRLRRTTVELGPVPTDDRL